MQFFNAIRPQNRLSSQQLIGIGTLVALILFWEILSRAGYLNPYNFPRPTKLAETMWALFTDGFPAGITIWQHVWATIWRILKGFLLAAVLAIPIGLYMGSSRILDQATGPIITFARSIAVISLLPLFVAWFGVGEFTRVLLITYGCFWVIVTNVIGAVKQVDVNLIRAARMLGADSRQMFLRVVLPSTIPGIFAGLKIALGVAFAVIVAVEMIGTVEGLGALIMQSRTWFRSDAAMVGMFIIALFGLFLAVALDKLERRLLPWAPDLNETDQ